MMIAQDSVNRQTQQVDHRRGTTTHPLTAGLDPQLNVTVYNNDFLLTCCCDFLAGKGWLF